MERIEDILFESGLLYVFAPDDRSADKSVVLAGEYDKSSREGVVLEVSSSDMRHFRSDMLLPDTYRMARAATPEECHDFFFNYGWAMAMDAISRMLKRMAD